MNRYYPDDPEVLYHTGRIYGNQAYVVMMKLHDKAPNSIWMLQAQGEANESQKNYDAALVSFKNVLELDPKRPGVHYRMGRIYLSRLKELGKQEDKEAAAAEFESELKVDPDNGNARYELGVVADQDGKLDVARQQFEQVLLRYPESEEALVALGGCYLEMSKPSEAVAPLERAARFRPDDEVAWYRLSRAQRANGDMDGAAKSMATFRKIHDPNQTGQKGPNSKAEVTPQRLDVDADLQSKSE
jgi:predicted Zn-dependent protease